MLPAVVNITAFQRCCARRRMLIRAAIACAIHGVFIHHDKCHAESIALITNSVLMKSHRTISMIAGHVHKRLFTPTGIDTFIASLRFSRENPDAAFTSIIFADFRLMRNKRSWLGTGDGWLLSERTARRTRNASTRRDIFA